MKSLSFLTSGGDSSSMPHPVHGGSNAQEHPSLHGLRKLQTQGMVCAIIFGILLGTMMAYCECYWSAAAVGGLVLVNVIGLPILWLTEHIEFACAFAAHGTCVFLLAIGWTFGGGPHSAGTIALAYMVQIQHRLQVPSRASSWCIAGIFLCGLVLAILERTVDPQYLTPQRARLPPTWYAVVFWFGTNWPGVLLYVILSQVMEELAESRRLLEASKADADCLNAELLQQQHRLKMERSLAYGLIFNVFPRSVSASLIELFEQYSHDPEQLGTLHHTSKAEAHPMAGCDSLSSICLTPDASSCASRDDFPHSASRRLQALVGRSLAPQRRRAAVMFGDIVRFTETASRLDASTLVEYLDCFFGQVSGGDEGVRTGGSDNTGEGLASQPRRYRMPGQPLLNRHQVDEICEEHEVEKIKTIGDCYMCVAFTEDGVEAQRRALGRVLAVADAMHDIAARTLLEGEPMSVRVGVHTGLVLTGIIGKTKFAFDLWGDAVNVASRMESTGVPGTTQITADAYALLEDKSAFMQRGPVEVKGKGKLVTYCSTGCGRLVPRAVASAPAGVPCAVQRLVSLLLTAKEDSPSPPSAPAMAFAGPLVE